MATDYPLVGPPTISLATFGSVLRSAGSPMAAEAPAIYSAILAKGVDPAVVLAISQHESNFGKAGIAVGRNNPYGSRYYGGAAAYGATNRGGWAAFPNYAQAAAYTAGLLASGSYAGAGLTARTFPTRYAPASDGNKPAAYGTAIVNAINRWRGEPTVGATPKATRRTDAPKAQAPAGAPVHVTARVDPGAAIGIVALLAILAVAFVIVRE